MILVVKNRHGWCSRNVLGPDMDKLHKALNHMLTEQAEKYRLSDRVYFNTETSEFSFEGQRV